MGGESAQSKAKAPAATFTVAVTAYNVRAYLRDCITSILKNGGADCAVFIVDDGSTDGTFASVEDMVRDHKNITYFYKANGGVSSARNFALDNVQTSHIIFVDGDDLVAKDGIKLLMKATKADNDITFSNRRRFSDGSRAAPSPRVFRRIAAGTMADARNAVRIVAIHGRAFRSQFLNDHAIRFPLGMVYEDAVFSYLTYANANKIASLPDVTYLYRTRADEDNISITQRPLEEHSIRDRLRQIAATWEIQKTPDWRARFAKGPSFHREFKVRLMKHVAAVAITPDETAARRAFQQLRKGIKVHEKLIATHATGRTRRALKHVLNGKFGELRKMGAFYRSRSAGMLNFADPLEEGGAKLLEAADTQS